METIMWTDPVVDEIHRIRAEMLAAAKGDVALLMAQVRARQEAGGRKIVGQVRRRKLVKNAANSGKSAQSVA